MLKRLIPVFALIAACQSAPAETPDPATSEAAEAASWREVDPENLVILSLLTGDVIIELAPEAAPAHVAQLRKAIRDGVYDGEYFYRVVENHVAQAGLEFDQRLADWPGLPFEAERTVSAEGFDPLGNADLFAPLAGHRNGFATAREGDQEWLLNCPGALGMARDEAPDTGSLDFFIPIAPRRYLDRNYTVFGRVIAGMEHVNRLKRVDPVEPEDVPAFFDPETEEDAFEARAIRLTGNSILSMEIAADMPEDRRPAWEVMTTPGPEWGALKAAKRDYSAIGAFVVTPPHVIDICSLPVPARTVSVQNNAD